MSYSFTVKAATKAAAKEAVADQMAAVARSQTVHTIDADAAVAAAGAFVDMLAEPTEELTEYQVMVSGSLQWAGDGVYTGANVTVNAYLRSKI